MTTTWTIFWVHFMWLSKMLVANKNRKL